MSEAAVDVPVAVLADATGPQPAAVSVDLYGGDQRVEIGARRHIVTEGGIALRKRLTKFLVDAVELGIDARYSRVGR